MGKRQARLSGRANGKNRPLSPPNLASLLHVKLLRIPNPRYDVVFRYLMNDEQISRSDWERFLSIFDQATIADDKGHILALQDADVPEAYQPVLRRLQQALANPELAADMDLEDKVLQEFEKKEAEILAMRQLAEREREQREEERRQRIEAQRREAEAQRLLVRVLAEQGLDVAAIC
jgi:hypothetical protein